MADDGFGQLLQHSVLSKYNRKSGRVLHTIIDEENGVVNVLGKDLQDGDSERERVKRLVRKTSVDELRSRDQKCFRSFNDDTDLEFFDSNTTDDVEIPVLTRLNTPRETYWINENMDSSQTSPQSSRMNHNIPHKWRRSAKLRLISDQTCIVCQRPLRFAFFNSWEKCRSCKCRVHTNCKSRIGDTCGLTPDHLRHWVESVITQSNTGLWNDPPKQETFFPFPPETTQVTADSFSSTNSSASSTPAAFRKSPNPLLGQGRFGDVLRGYHFGDVAVKFLNMDYVEESKRLDEFNNVIATYKNTRHENVVLFLGYCLGEGRFGIVTNFCKGQSLYRIIHETREEMDLSTAHQIAVQICQGVSYLHTKNILHKDLRTKNIFIERNYKVVITDFGLASMKRLLHPPRENAILLSRNWLAYQAPEIIQSIAVDGRNLPYSVKSDSYSFGTIWYELLTFEFPFSKEHPDRIIYFIGSGQSFPLNNNRTNEECKHKILDIVAKCWKFNVDDRPIFSEISKKLLSIPLHQLDRSPSNPVKRSYESLF